MTRAALRSSFALGLVLVGLWSIEPAAAVMLEACRKEVLRANDSLATIFRQWPLRPTGDPVSQALQAITTQFAARAGEQAHRRWRTYVLRDSKLNALSIGDGHVFVTEGMLRFVDSEAELAALLAHEFAHHVAGHFCERKKKAGFFRNLWGEDDAVAVPRKVGELSASVDPTKEREADRIGAVILERGGFNPNVAVLLAARMAASGTPAHFQYGRRIEALQRFLSKRPRVHRPESDSEAFTRMKGALGADPSNG